MFEGLAPDLGPRIALAVGGVALALIVLVAVLVFLKRRNSPLFIKGGRAREHRLHVLDAAAVDAKRRLVLIRRDNTEHLIMIGGPTDIVIETGISGQEHVSGTETAARTEQPAKQVSRPELQSEPVRSQSPRPLAGAPRSPEAAQAEERPQSPRIEGDVQQARVATPAQVPASSQRPAQATTPATPAPQTADVENILDQARSRVLQSTPTDEERQAAERRRLEAARAEQARIEARRAEAAKAEAQRLEAVRVAEAARLEAARVEAQKRLEAQRNAQVVAVSTDSNELSLRQPSVKVAEQTPDIAHKQATLASDFARFLENELEAGGILNDGPAPEIQGERRGGPVQPAVTGAYPATSAEQDMARRLGEAQVNRKADPSA